MEKKKIYGSTLKEQLIASIRDRLYNFVIADGAIRGVLVHGTRMVNEMRWNHGLGVLETLVLGHAYLAAALMSANLKGNDRLAIDVECSGPIKGLHVESNAFGEVRGYLSRVPIPVYQPLQSFDLAPFFGAGFLSVTRYLEDAKSPFVGKVMMAYGTLAKDLAVYYLKSEQVPTSFSLSVAFDGDGEVQGAGGMFLQALPGAEDSVLSDLESLVRALPSLGHVVQEDGFPEKWLQQTFDALTPKILDRRGIEFMCHCNRGQIETMLGMLDHDELEDMARRGPFPIAIRCHHCNTTYPFSQDEIAAIAFERKGRWLRKK
jgi:molecular chaperone Hsp33